MKLLEIYISHLKSVHIPKTRTGQWESSLPVKSQFTELFLLLRKPVISPGEQSTEKHQIPNTGLAGNHG